VIKYRQNQFLNEGILFFNIGTSCLLRLTLAIYSLRKYFNGKVAVLLEETDANLNFIEQCLYKFNILKFYFERPDLKCQKNNGYTIKPFVLNLSPFETTVFSDADVLFRDNPQELIDLTRKENLIFTPYRDWVTTGKMMNKRIISLSDILPKEQISKALDYGIAINTGVLGYNKHGSEEFFNDWIDTTYKAKCRFIIDEIACQCICYKYSHVLTDKKWNYSCREKDMSKGKIIHFHGKKHARPNKCPASKIWIEEFDEFIGKKILPNDISAKLINWDKYVRRLVKK